MEKSNMDRKEIKRKRLKTTTSEEYRFVEKLLTASFPADEYRPLEEQRRNVESIDMFHMNILFAGEESAGLLSYWQFEEFVYVEHFAVLPTLRGKGYGCEAISGLIKEKGRIVLEVELPTDDLSRRRITFYTRCGLTLSPEEYIQPAYRAGGNEIPMRLMYCGVDMEQDYEQIKSSIYRTVYGKST